MATALISDPDERDEPLECDPLCFTELRSRGIIQSGVTEGLQIIRKRKGLKFRV
jgi:hypothetical protein